MDTPNERILTFLQAVLPHYQIPPEHAQALSKMLVDKKSLWQKGAGGNNGVKFKNAVKCRLGKKNGEKCYQALVKCIPLVKYL